MAGLPLKRKGKSESIRQGRKIVVVQKEVLCPISIEFVAIKLCIVVHFDIILLLQMCLTNLTYLGNNFLKSSQRLDLSQNVQFAGLGYFFFVVVKSSGFFHGDSRLKFVYFRRIRCLFFYWACQHSYFKLLTNQPGCQSSCMQSIRQHQRFSSSVSVAGCLNPVWCWFQLIPEEWETRVTQSSLSLEGRNRFKLYWLCQHKYMA